MHLTPARRAHPQSTTVVLVALLTASATGRAQHSNPVSTGQTGSHSTSSTSRSAGSYSPFDDMGPEIDQVAEHSRERARATERQKRMVEDANRLVALTKQYRDNVERQRGTTPEDARLLLDIQKLARSVKDRMRGQ